MRPVAALPADIERARGGGAFGLRERQVAAATVERVRRRGDDAVLAEVRRFDRRGATRDELLADRGAIRTAARRCPPELARALEQAHARIRAFHLRQRPRTIRRADARGSVELVPTPLDRVGALVPRGAGSYPSTALMTGVPARVAGVRRLVFASPLPAGGGLDPALAYALRLVDADALYRAGGAAAVAALAYGTALVERVDLIVGPGNAFTAAAKWLVSADVGIDALQGPSELIAVASGGASPEILALELLAQAEHGSGAFAALISDDATLLRATAGALRRAAAAASRRAAHAASGPAAATALHGPDLRRVVLYRAPDLRAAATAADSAAPEHVLLAGAAAARLAPAIRHAGALFVGERSAVPFGDYVAGSNHSLPTGGTARWASALRVEDYVRWTSRVGLRGDLRALARAGAAIARHEQMAFHAASLEARVPRTTAARLEARVPRTSTAARLGARVR